MNVKDEVVGRWASVLPLLGVDARYLVDRHGPCPICHGKDRFRFDDKLNGSYYCNQCGAGDGFTLLQKIHGWDFFTTRRKVEGVLGLTKVAAPKVERTEEDKATFLRGLYDGSRPIQPGDPAWTYLESRLGTLDVGQLRDLRYHPRARHTIARSYHPCLLQAMRPAGGGQTCGYQRLYLDGHGRKASVEPVRLTTGRLGVVQLSLPAPHLGIAEGAETALAAAARFGLPVWSAVSAHGLEVWESPVGTTAVTVFGDNDLSYTGQAAAYALARRLHAAGLEVSVEVPPAVGTDWADVR